MTFFANESVSKLVFSQFLCHFLFRGVLIVHGMHKGKLPDRVTEFRICACGARLRIPLWLLCFVLKNTKRICTSLKVS